MSKLFIAVDPDIDLPPFQQIVEQIRAFIECGKLHPGNALPTVRQLAGDLGVTPNTVARAYAELQQEGWLAGEGRRGSRVALKTPATDKRASMRGLRDAIADVVNSLSHRGFAASEIASQLEAELRSFGRTQP